MARLKRKPVAESKERPPVCSLSAMPLVILPSQSTLDFWGFSNLARLPKSRGAKQSVDTKGANQTKLSEDAEVN